MVLGRSISKSIRTLSTYFACFWNYIMSQNIHISLKSILSIDKNHSTLCVLFTKIMTHQCFPTSYPTPAIGVFWWQKGVRTLLCAPTYGWVTMCVNTHR